jgi:2-phospho-L-lactate guanylyltransferase
MSLWAIVPVKPLKRSKSRLSGVLSDDERAVLNYTMLGNTLKTLKQVSTIDELLVVSRDPKILSLARSYKARTIQEDSSAPLNVTLSRAAFLSQAFASQMVLILAADLPMLSPEDIYNFLSCVGQPPEIVIAPDRKKRGINCLLVNPAGLVEYKFGSGSYDYYVSASIEKNIRLVESNIPSLSFDLDTPEDLEQLRIFETEQLTQRENGELL